MGVRGKRPKSQKDETRKFKREGGIRTPLKPNSHMEKLRKRRESRRSEISKASDLR